MKSVLLIVACLTCLVSSFTITPKTEAITEALRARIEDFRAIMPYGIPDMGIPPLAPLRFPDIVLDTDAPGLRITGSVNNFTVSLLDTFEVTELWFGVPTLRVDFQFVWPRISAYALYVLDAVLRDSITLFGNGDFNLDLLNVSATGHVQFGVEDSFVVVREVIIKLHMDGAESNIENLMGGGALGDFVNRVIEKMLPEVLDFYEIPLTFMINEMATSFANMMLYGLTLEDLINLITGGSVANSNLVN